MTILEKATIGLGSVAFLGLIWAYVKIALGWIKNLFVVSQFATDPDFNALITSYLNYACPRHYSLGDKMHGEYRAFVKSLRRVAPVLFYNVTISKTLFFWKAPKARRSWPIAVTSAETAASGRAICYMYVRGTVDWVELTRQACEYQYEISQMAGRVHGNRYRVTHHTGTRGMLAGLTLARARDKEDSPDAPIKGGCNPGVNMRSFGQVPMHFPYEDIGPDQSSSAFDALSLTPELLDLVEEIKFWHDEEDWYDSRGVPWRRGYVFEGKPGTGKTSFVRALAEELDLPIHIPDLSTMDNGELGEAWAKALANTPCIILIEDVDAVFNGRSNIANKVLTFDCLLNCIDGVERANGVLLVVTTNHLELVDPALGGPAGASAVSADAMPERPGRVDRVVHFAELDDAGRKKMALRIMRDCPHEIPAQIAVGGADTAAQFQERCFRVALHHKFNSADKNGNIHTETR
jgi:hypothetical protein